MRFGPKVSHNGRMARNVFIQKQHKTAREHVSGQLAWNVLVQKSHMTFQRFRFLYYLPNVHGFGLGLGIKKCLNGTLCTSGIR